MQVLYAGTMTSIRLQARPGLRWTMRTDPGRKNIEYKEYPGLDHFELQDEQTTAAYDWLLKKKS